MTQWKYLKFNMLKEYVEYDIQYFEKYKIKFFQFDTCISIMEIINKAILYFQYLVSQL